MPKLPTPHRIGEAREESAYAPGGLPDELRDRLSTFLEQAEPLLFAPGTKRNPFSDSPQARVRIGVMTDGEWVWDLAWSDYVQYENVAPPAEFLDHIAALEYKAPEITVERAMEIIEAEGIRCLTEPLAVPLDSGCVAPDVHPLALERG